MYIEIDTHYRPDNMPSNLCLLGTFSILIICSKFEASRTYGY